MRSRHVTVFIGALALGLAGATAFGQARNGEDVAISARTFNGYQRTRLPDGTLKPERYVVGEGGRWAGGKPDATLDALPFAKIAAPVAAALRPQAYVPATDAK